MCEIWCPEAAVAPIFRELRDRAQAASVPVHTTAHAGDVRARAEPYPELSFETLLVAARRPLHLVALDHVTDVGNLGAIARAAETAGVQGLILEQRHSPAIGPGALRASAGALEHLPLARVPHLERALRLAKQEGVRILVADPMGDTFASLPPEHWQGDLLWVLGSEDKGVRPAIRGLADVLVAIPCRGALASLNVAAAAAYLLHRAAEHRAVEP